MEGEYVIKVGDDSYYGFGHKPESIRSYFGWLIKLMDSYNEEAKRKKNGAR